MDRLTVYNRMTASTVDLFNVLRDEIGVKTNCLPFAIKAIESLSSLGGLTEAESIKAAHTFLSDMQTLTQAGITAEDYNKIDFVKRGKVITISARIEAFLRAAKNKGYIITDKIVAVPKEDNNTTYFNESFKDGEFIYEYVSGNKNLDRTITAERLVSGYFSKFICRLEIKEAKSLKRVMMTACEMSNEEIINAQASSDNGIYKSRWEKYRNEYGYEKNRKVFTNEFNTESIWYKWTSEMVTKTIIRRALKRVREVLPDLSETIYAFEKETIPQEQEPAQIPEINIPIETNDVDLNNLSEQQKEEVAEMYDIFVANPKLAADKAKEIIETFNGNNVQEIINIHYASIANIKNSPKVYPVIAPLFESPVDIKPKEGLYCAVCGKEITSEKSKKYYAAHPNYTVKCFDCNKKGKS